MRAAPIDINPIDGGGYYPPIDDGGGGTGGGGGTITNPPAVPPPTGTGGTNSGVFTPNLAITPNTEQRIAVGTQRCFTAQATASIAEESLRYAQIDPVIIHGCIIYDPNIGLYRKNCGSQAIFDTEAYVPQKLYKFQPGYIQAANDQFNVVGGTNGNNHSTIVGLRSITNSYRFYWQVLRYCNSTANVDCTSGWFANVQINYPDGSWGLIMTIPVNFNEYFRIRSDGFNIIWERKSAGVWYSHYVLPIPSDCGDFQFFLDAYFMQNTWTHVQTYRGSWQGNVSVNWSVPDGGSLTGTGNTRCFSASTVGEYSICVDTEFNDEVCVPIVVEPLFFEPIDRDCGDCVFTGEIIEFESNASGGILTADIGTIIDNNKWLVPTPEVEEV